MFGWTYVVQDPDTHQPVVWDTGLDGIDVMDDLVAAGLAQRLGGDGYPYRYVVSATVIREIVRRHPPTIFHQVAPTLLFGRRMATRNGQIEIQVYDRS
jgi:hypothetical protein